MGCHLPVLCLHHVAPRPGPHCASVAELDCLLSSLMRAGFRGLSADGIAEYVQDGRRGDDKVFALTFDDGYRDNWAYAHPILERYSVPATLFTVTSYAGNGPPRSDHAAVPASHEACQKLIANGDTDGACLRWSELRLMQASGLWSIQSHTHTHTRLGEMDAAAAAATVQLDCKTSRDMLESELGSAPTHLAWPWGYHDAAWLEGLEKFGFRFFHTLGHELIQPGARQQLIPRLIEKATGLHSPAFIKALSMEPWLSKLVLQPRRQLRRHRLGVRYV